MNSVTSFFMWSFLVLYYICSLGCSNAIYGERTDEEANRVIQDQQTAKAVVAKLRKALMDRDSIKYVEVFCGKDGKDRKLAELDFMLYDVTTMLGESLKSRFGSDALKEFNGTDASGLGLIIDDFADLEHDVRFSLETIDSQQAILTIRARESNQRVLVVHDKRQGLWRIDVDRIADSYENMEETVRRLVKLNRDIRSQKIVSPQAAKYEYESILIPQNQWPDEDERERMRSARRQLRK